MLYFIVVTITSWIKTKLLIFLSILKTVQRLMTDILDSDFIQTNLENDLSNDQNDDLDVYNQMSKVKNHCKMFMTIILILFKVQKIIIVLIWNITTKKEKKIKINTPNVKCKFLM